MIETSGAAALTMVKRRRTRYGGGQVPLAAGPVLPFGDVISGLMPADNILNNLDFTGNADFAAGTPGDVNYFGMRVTVRGVFFSGADSPAIVGGNALAAINFAPDVGPVPSQLVVAPTMHTAFGQQSNRVLVCTTDERGMLDIIILPVVQGGFVMGVRRNALYGGGTVVAQHPLLQIVIKPLVTAPTNNAAGAVVTAELLSFVNPMTQELEDRLQPYGDEASVFARFSLPELLSPA